MPSRYFDIMANLAVQASREPTWWYYADYCKSRAKELKERSSLRAVQFSRTAMEWSFDDRKKFSIWCMSWGGWARENYGHSKYESRATAGGRGLIEPRIVIMTILIPTLIQWCDQEPDDPEPHYWLALYDHSKHPAAGFREAIRLDPTFGPARAALAEHIAKYIKGNQHDVPSRYMGTPADDLADLAEAAKLLTAAVEAPARASLGKEIATLRRVAEDWLKLRTRLVEIEDQEARLEIWRSRALPVKPKGS